MPGDSVAIAEARLGFYGKLPAKGDFLGRRLPRSFIDAWDAWLQDAVGQSREAMGEAWLEAYLTSPLWRFVLSPGLCGPDAIAGVMMPSVDRVGRYFPLALAMPVAGCRAPVQLALGDEEWFRRAEEMALSTLDEGADFDGFDAAVAEIGAPRSVAAAAGLRALGEACAVEIAGLDGLGKAAPELLDAVIAALVPRWSLWWSAGSEAVAPTFMVAAGLPPPHGFAALLDGGWERWGWTRP
jgi:type VI secretion system protein ImpM